MNIPSQSYESKGREDPEDGGFYELTLYIIGASTNSTRAVTNLKEMLETTIKGRYSLEIIDVHQQREIAELEQIIALPLLVKRHPKPVRKLIGDMSDTVRVLAGLGINAV